MNPETLLRQAAPTIFVEPAEDFATRVGVKVRRLARRRVAAQGAAVASVVAVTGGVALAGRPGPTGPRAVARAAQGSPTRSSGGLRVARVAAPAPAPVGSVPVSVMPDDAALAAGHVFYADQVGEQVRLDPDNPHSRSTSQTWTPRHGTAVNLADGAPNEQAVPPPSFAFMGSEGLSWDELAALPSDPATLEQMLAAAAKVPADTTDPTQVVGLALDALGASDSGGAPVPSAQRAGLEQVVAHLPGAEDEGLALDDLGRVAHSYYLPLGGLRVWFSGDAVPLEQEEYDALGQTLDRSTLTASGLVGSMTQTLPTAGDPPAVADPAQQIVILHLVLQGVSPECAWTTPDRSCPPVGELPPSPAP